jgi:hypothetical protein
MRVFLHKALALYLALIMLVSSVGVHFIEHFCTEKNHKTISLYISNGCEDQSKDNFSCCSEAEDIEMDNSKSSCNDCCITTENFQKTDLKTFITQIFDFNISTVSLVTFLPYNFLINETLSNLKSDFSDTSPPIIRITDIQSEFQIFRC